VAAFRDRAFRSDYARLLRYAVPHWRGWAGIAGATALSTGVTLLQPWPMQVVVDHVLARTPPSGLVARLAAVLPGAARPTGLLAWAVVAGLALFGLHAAVDAVLARRWVGSGSAWCTTWRATCSAACCAGRCCSTPGRPSATRSRA
jgi:hypothetical protein